MAQQLPKVNPSLIIARIPDDRVKIEGNLTSETSENINKGELHADRTIGKFLRRNQAASDSLRSEENGLHQADIIMPRPPIPEQHNKYVSPDDSGGHNYQHTTTSQNIMNSPQESNHHPANNPPQNVNNVHVVEGSARNDHAYTPQELLSTIGGGEQGISTNSAPADASTVAAGNQATTRPAADNTNVSGLAMLTKSVSGRRTFPTKLFDILARDDVSHIISWLPHGRSWKVHDQNEFEAKVMPVYFQQTKFASFARQVTGWGFKRITAGGPDRNSYYHELFLRDEPRLHVTMKRPVKKRHVEMMPGGGGEPDFYSLSGMGMPGNGLEHHRLGMHQAAAVHHPHTAHHAHAHAHAHAQAGHPAQQHLNLYAAAAAAHQPAPSLGLASMMTSRGALSYGTAASDAALFGAAASLDPYGRMQFVMPPAQAAAPTNYPEYARVPAPATGNPYGLGAAASGLLFSSNGVGAGAPVDSRLQLLDNVNVNASSNNPHAAYANMLGAGAALSAGRVASTMGLVSYPPSDAVNVSQFGGGANIDHSKIV